MVMPTTSPPTPTPPGPNRQKTNLRLRANPIEEWAAEGPPVIFRLAKASHKRESPMGGFQLEGARGGGSQL